jgi:hypothetical protein
MAELNWERSRAGYVQLEFHELDPASRTHVLERAQELKSPPAPGQWKFIPIEVSSEDPAGAEPIDPWWIRAGRFLFRAVRWTLDPRKGCF